MSFGGGEQQELKIILKVHYFLANLQDFANHEHRSASIAYPFTVLGDDEQRFHLSTQSEKAHDVFVVEPAEQVDLASTVGNVDLSPRQQGLHHDDGLCFAVAEEARLGQKHVAIVTLTCCQTFYPDSDLEG